MIAHWYGQRSMVDDTDVSQALEQLRRTGGRVTQQRRLVLQALVDAQPHPSAEDVAERVAAVAPDVHMSTVYRTLNTLTELGVISHVHIDHGPSLYHFADDVRPHLVCRQCGRVDHVDAETFEAVRATIESASGFRLDRGHFAWSANCPACRDDLD